MSRGRAPNRHDADHSSHMASSFTDLMASLMVIFVLLFVATVNNARAKRHVVQADLLKELRAKLGANGLDPGSIRQDERDPYAIVIVMPDSLLFKRGRWDVEPAGQSYLEGMMPTLAQIVCAKDMAEHIDNVVVEGHTDTTYLGATGVTTPERGPEFNLELSQRRSMEVVHTSLSALQNRADRACFRRMLAASGRGQEELLPNIAGDDARQRRVVFKIRVQQDLARELGEEVAAPNASTSVSSRSGIQVQ